MSSSFAQVAVEAHVRTTTDGQKGLVDVRNLEDDALGDSTAQYHEKTSALTQVRDRLTIGDLVLDPRCGRLPWYNCNILANASLVPGHKRSGI